VTAGNCGAFGTARPLASVYTFKTGGNPVATIIVGVDDTPRSEDAIALAGQLARSAVAEMVAACERAARVTE
jgi:hypothetical protein